MDPDPDDESLSTQSISNLNPSMTEKQSPKRKQHVSHHLEETLSILTNYGLPKTSQYYLSKGKTCILDKYHNEIAQSFIDNDINIQKLYSSSIRRSQFVSDIIRYIHNPNDLCDMDSSLQTAIKKLYTILQLHQHIEPRKQNISNTPNGINSYVMTASTAQRQNNRKRQRNDTMVRELSRSQSEILSLQEKNDILNVVAQETQKKLIQTEQKQYEYIEKVDALQSTQNQINHKMMHLEQENETLKRLISVYQDMNMKENISDNEDDDDDGDTEQELMILNDKHIMNLRHFYKSVTVQTRNERKNIDEINENNISKNFWEKLLDGFQCIPSFK